MTDRVFVDTNVLVYAVDAANPTKQDRALSLIRESPTHEVLVLSTQVLAEFYTVATKRIAEPLESDEAEETVRDLSRFTIVRVDTDVVLSAIRVAREYQLSLWDAQILVAARQGGCSRLLTEDLQHGFELDGVRVENPFL